MTTAKRTPGSSGILGKIVTAKRVLIYAPCECTEEHDDDGQRDVSDGDGRRRVGRAQRLGEQEADQSKIEVPDPGGCEQGQDDHGVRAETAEAGGKVIERQRIVGGARGIGRGFRRRRPSHRFRRESGLKLERPLPRSEPLPRNGWAEPSARRYG